MFWHIDTDLISLLVICALLAYNARLSPKQERALRDRRFAWCLYAGAIVTLIDIAASLVMELPSPRWLYHGLMLGYFISIELVIVSWFYYVIVILYHDDEPRLRAVSLVAAFPFALFCLLVLSNPWTGLFYTLSPENVYTRGPGFLLLVALYALYSGSLLVLIALRRRHIPPRYPGVVLALIPIIEALAIAVQLSVPGWLTIMPGYMLCLVLIFLFFQSVRLESDREERALLEELIGHVSCGFAISRISPQHELSIEYLNDGYHAICEAPAGELKTRYDADILAGIHPDDRAAARAKLDETAATLCGHEMVYRYLTGTGKQKWLYVQAKVVRHEDGSGTAYSTFTDITEQIALQRQLADIIHTVPCGICLFRWDDGHMHPLLANTQFSEMLGLDALSHMEEIGGLDFRLVFPEDREGLRAALLKALEETHFIDYTFRLHAADGQIRWIRERGTLVLQPDSVCLIYCSFFDVTQEHLTAQRLRESEQALEYATAQAGLCFWRYDPYTDRAYPDEGMQHALGLPPVRKRRDIGGEPEKEYVALYRNACRRIREGEKQVGFELLLDTGDKVPHAFRCCLTNLFDEHGKPTIAVGTAILIDAEKELGAKYELERRRTALEGEKLIAHAIFDLSTGEVREYAYSDGKSVPFGDRYALFYARDRVQELLIDDEERSRFTELNDARYLLSRFEKGETEFRLDYRRRDRRNSIVSWVRLKLHLLREPESGNILLFTYWYDIEEEKMLELMYRSLASDNYDFVARINGRTRQFVAVARAGLTHHMPPTAGEDADAVTLGIYSADVLPEDREMTIQNTLVDNIRSALRRSSRFQFTYRALHTDGSLLYKRVTQYYIDPQREIIVMTREDVTELIRAETEKNAILAAALKAANEASNAKSQFLSRVSHELRTPLNAILGFIELAREADAQQTAVYLANSDIAAKQLLSIINDVLDMSSIEAGKLKLASAPFDLRRMVHSITNIYLAQCRQKGLSFETKLLTPLDEWLVGDPMRVNQILMNLLGNAVKFTAQGGVELRVSQRESTGARVLVRFEIADTGCGISEAMQARLFKPFEQETAATAQKYGGNGLGLSIVSSLVEMMGGLVRVESRQGVGSVFLVDLPFERSEAPLSPRSLGGIEALRVLAVDDEAAERDYLTLVLNRMGVRHSCVGDGNEALAALEAAERANDPYTLCLLDWKMPAMDGFETTRRIREKYGRDVIVIVVSAYEHYQADEEAKEAGADLFVTKPLFQSSLFDLLSTLTGGRIAKKAKESARQDFKGRRVLLVEDNAMNRLVAESLVRRFGADCDIAEDGRVALEKYSACAPGYYDAILMDIQMPNMDGFAATRTIRDSGRADAQSVPIIALTANAFSEDIAKTLSGGMNAHVAKPIEPALLAAALAEAFAAKDAASRP